MTTVSLGYFPRDWQRECHRKRRRFTVYALHRRAGKTELAIMELIDKAMRFSQDLGLFFYVAPYLKQAKAIAWARLKSRIEPLRRYGLVDISEAELSVTFRRNGAVIRVYGADNPDAMRGVRLDGVVIDEVAQIRPEIWNDVIQPALSDRKGWALFIGTPQGVNLFSELFHKARGLPDWHSARYTVFDTAAIDGGEGERLKRDMSDASFAREYLCDFSAAGDDQLVSLSDVEAAARRVVPMADVQLAPRIIGVDPARFGDDRSVIFRRQGLVAHEPESLRSLDNMALAARVASAIDAFRPDAVFVDAGNGAGVIDRLRQLGYAVIEVPFGGRALSAQYVNKRAEMWFEMADWLRGGGSIPDRTDLKQDLAAPVYAYDAQGRKQLESKDEIKKRGLPSPDLGDALALTFAFPVRPKSEAERLGIRRAPSRDYDPFARGR